MASIAAHVVLIGRMKRSTLHDRLEYVQQPISCCVITYNEELTLQQLTCRSDNRAKENMSVNTSMYCTAILTPLHAHDDASIAYAPGQTLYCTSRTAIRVV